MANVSRKKLANQIRELVERKGEINRPGGLIPYLVHELNLTGNSTIRDPLIEALALLEAQGIIEVDRRGEKTYDAIRRTKRKRARSTSAPTPSKKETAIPTTTAERPKVAASAARPVPTAPKVTRKPAAPHMEEPNVVFTSESMPSEAPSTSSQPEATPAENATAKDPTPIEEMSPMEIIVELTAKYEELGGILEREQADHAETTRQKQVIAEAKQGVEAKLAAKQRELEGKDREITGLNRDLSTEQATNENLRGQLSSLTDTLTTGAETLERLQEELRLAHQKNAELEQRDDVSLLASRVTAILRPTTPA